MANFVWTFPDAEDLVCSYLNPLCPNNVRPEMDNSAGLPFVLIRCIAAGNDGVTDYASVQVDFFHNNRSSANDLAQQGHSLMVDIKSAPISVNGQLVSIDRFQVIQRPIWMPYDDENLKRFVGRYQLDTRICVL
ncbi:hypothetical protein EF294_03475 [Gordonia oryzae]|uniref:DUF3168 domain-containing protein n=1 Tax=Gordonia oryzae TaxID=2487349 RepID=A0A3N4H4R4_9ACTN|nr:hypothetical protein [Gordonia oryzae]RPA65810.1 hypothetical protein EF294_03475 [Gordonia oryzae]